MGPRKPASGPHLARRLRLSTARPGMAGDTLAYAANSLVFPPSFAPVLLDFSSQQS